MASFLDRVFHSFDFNILSGYHNLAESAGGFFTPFFKAVSLLGYKGIFFILASLVLCCFAKTRKLGLNIIFAVGVSFVIAFIVKHIVARARPYAADETIAAWHILVGGKMESDLSFPSGHVTVTMAAALALFLTMNKKWSYCGGILVILMCASRNYLMVHYPTDVIAGVIIGAIGAVIAYFIIKFVYKFMEKKKDNKFFNFVLEGNVIPLKEKKNETVEEDAEEPSEEKEKEKV